MRIFKWIKPLSFVLALVLVNSLLSFCIVPVRGSSGTMWEEYYREEELDTVFIGASFCAASFDPYIFNERLDIKSFNMGTPLQAIGQTISAVETAIEDYEIEQIIIGMGFFSLQQGAYDKAELTFERAKAEQKGGIAGVLESLEYMLSEDVRSTEKSVNYLFPWLYNQEEVSLGFISKNITAKMENAKIGENAVSRKGYRCFDADLDYETAWEINSYTYYSQKLDEELIQQFEELLSMCKESGADVIVINSPHPAFDVISCYETYGENEAKVKELCDKQDVEYYNFSLAKPELFDAKDGYYFDFEHLNGPGTEAFCNAFCDLLQKREYEDKLESYFYTVEEYFNVHAELLEEWKAEQQKIG